MADTKLLLVEDDTNLGGILQEYLMLKNYDVTLATDGDAGFDAYQRDTFDLCIIDVMMPKKDGFTLVAEIRKTDNITPIIFLTAKSMKEDKIEGFKLGADDYITKPFSIEELLLRIEAVLRRCQASAKQILPKDAKEFTIGGYFFDYEHQLLKFGEKKEQLTLKEAELLKQLCLHTNDVLKRENALKLIWGDDSYFNGRSMDVFITKLRKYLREDPRVEIQNIYGTGYKLRIE